MDKEVLNKEKKHEKKHREKAKSAKLAKKDTLIL
jgi:hypothetical protein